MGSVQQLVVFTMEHQRFAVPLETVLRVLSAVEVTPLPGAPESCVGLFDLRGTLVPVIDRRGRGAASIRVSDQFVVVRSGERLLALVVDDVQGVVATEPLPLPVPPGTKGEGAYAGATRLDDQLVLIHDIEAFLAPHEAEAMDRALEAAT